VNDLKEAELKYCQEAVANYKRLSPVIGQGDLYRLVSPYEEDRAVLQYVDAAKVKSVLFSYTLHPLYDPNFPFVRLQGLNPSKKYQVTEINGMPGIRRTFEESGKTFSGDFLMKNGLKVSSGTKESSVVLELTAVE
jgi:alpha-galactosidase